MTFLFFFPPPRGEHCGLTAAGEAPLPIHLSIRRSAAEEAVRLVAGPVGDELWDAEVGEDPFAAAVGGRVVLPVEETGGGRSAAARCHYEGGSYA